MDQLFGWAGPELAKEQFDVFASRGEANTFAIKAKSSSTAGKKLELWKFTKQVFGRHVTMSAQLDDDCTANGAANATNYLQCTEIVLNKDKQAFKPAYRPYIYGISRVKIGGGRLGRQGGSLGIWTAKACKDYGVLPNDIPGLPVYSKAILQDWGFNGPPDQYIRQAAPFKINTYAIVRSYEDIRDAVINGYPVTIASDRGFNMQPIKRNGKMFGVPNGQWHHQMMIPAIDDTDGSGYILNSWGPDAHGRPLNDEPPGGFWVDAEVLDYIASQGDSWAYSAFDGYPERVDELTRDDFDVFK